MLTNLLLGVQDSTENMERLIPDIHKTGSNLEIPAREGIIIKSHLMMSDSMPLLANTAGFVYIVRNPLVIAISSLHYRLLLAGIPATTENITREKERYITAFIQNHGDPEYRNAGFGSWDEHVVSWLTNERQLPSMVVKYEDLCADPLKQLGKINDFLTFGKSTEEMQRAVQNSTFEKMRALEEQELVEQKSGFFYTEHNANSIRGGNRFMRSGTPKLGKEPLNESEESQLLEIFAPIMQKLGYL